MYKDKDIFLEFKSDEKNLILLGITKKNLSLY